MSETRKRRFFALTAVVLTLLLGGIAIAFVLEFKQRTAPIYLQEPGHELTGHRYLYDSDLGWRNIPDWEATTYGKPLKINSRGLRDREYPYGKPKGVRRILVLGDSYTWGYGVRQEEIFTEVLEASLAPEWEVINAGVSMGDRPGVALSRKRGVPVRAGPRGAGALSG